MQIIAKSWIAPFILVILCIAVTVFFEGEYPYILISALLFLPFLDQKWNLPGIANEVSVAKKYGLLLIVILLFLLLILPFDLTRAMHIFFLVALPEEWFFRGYLLSRLGGNVRANIISSVIFSLLHGVTKGPVIALEVFVPSLFYGWLYQKTGSILLCVYAHAVSNIIFLTVLKPYFYFA